MRWVLVVVLLAGCFRGGDGPDASPNCRPAPPTYPTHDVCWDAGADAQADCNELDGGPVSFVCADASE